MENGPVAYATSRRVPHCYELCALNPYFSQRLRAPAVAVGTFVSPADGETSRSTCVPIASRHQRPVTENRRKREQSRPFAVHNRRDDDARRKCSRTRTRTRACFAGKETVPYRRQLYSRCKIVSGACTCTRRDPRTHGRARGAK